MTRYQNSARQRTGEGVSPVDPAPSPATSAGLGTRDHDQRHPLSPPPCRPGFAVLTTTRRKGFIPPNPSLWVVAEGPEGKRMVLAGGHFSLFDSVVDKKLALLPTSIIFLSKGGQNDQLYIIRSTQGTQNSREPLFHEASDPALARWLHGQYDHPEALTAISRFLRPTSRRGLSGVTRDLP